MVYEYAKLTIAPGREAEFEAAFAEALAIFEQAHGCEGAELERCVESASYQLVVAWETLEDHTVGFRQSPLFDQWRGLVGEFFAAPPEVLHYAPVR